MTSLTESAATRSAGSSLAEGSKFYFPPGESLELICFLFLLIFKAAEFYGVSRGLRLSPCSRSILKLHRSHFEPR
jgi:hypothetical protein